MVCAMSRPLRIELAGGLYHVTSRGDRREAIYRDDQDRTNWLDVLGEVCSRFNWRCHAWCGMTNHYHFVVETPDANLSKGMRQLNGVYTQMTNRRHGLVGHLFQGAGRGQVSHWGSNRDRPRFCAGDGHLGRKTSVRRSTPVIFCGRPAADGQP
jgi:REP element-mobilizing transposase RayT